MNRKQARRAATYSPRVRLVRPGRDQVIRGVVETMLAASPSLAVARKAIEAWPGHPKDLAMRTDVLALLDRLASEGRTG